MLDSLIIGSGPAGLSAAIYLKRAGLNVLVAEKMYYGTGQIAESSQVDNYLGFVGINGYELGMKFREHAVSLGVEFKNGEADGFTRLKNGWCVHFTNGEEVEAKTVVFATGASHRHLNVPGEEEFSGRGVSYCATCDGAFFRGKDTAIVGGGNTAMDDALYLSEVCNKVYLIHRREEFRGAAGTLEKIKEKENIELVTENGISKIIGEGTVSEIELLDGRKLSVSGVFIAVGMEPQTTVLKGLGVLDENGYVIADESGKTTQEGFFAAGDVRTKAVRQVITAASDGANVAASVMEYLNKM